MPHITEDFIKEEKAKAMEPITLNALIDRAKLELKSKERTGPVKKHIVKLLGVLSNTNSCNWLHAYHRLRLILGIAKLPDYLQNEVSKRAIGDEISPVKNLELLDALLLEEIDNMYYGLGYKDHAPNVVQ